MSGDASPRLDACAVDVRAHLERSVASLYSHLITRPTGRAVRMAIESQLGDLASPALSLLDISDVSVLDYSCADEVVAKLLLRYEGGAEGVYFLLRGVGIHHLDPIEAVLERHGLAVVAETAPARFELLGTSSEKERDLWRRVEERRRVPAREVHGLGPKEGIRADLELLVRRRLLFRDPVRGDLHALSTLIGPAG